MFKKTTPSISLWLEMFPHFLGTRLHCSPPRLQITPYGKFLVLNVLSSIYNINIVQSLPTINESCKIQNLPSFRITIIQLSPTIKLVPGIHPVAVVEKCM